MHAGGDTFKNPSHYEKFCLCPLPISSSFNAPPPPPTHFKHLPLLPPPTPSTTPAPHKYSIAHKRFQLLKEVAKRPIYLCKRQNAERKQKIVPSGHIFSLGYIIILFFVYWCRTLIVEDPPIMYQSIPSLTSPG